MLPYQARYIENTREIARLSDVYGASLSDFEAWYAAQRNADAQMAALKKENDALLAEHLFPTLDHLYSASQEELNSLEEFAAALMDWSINLDCGVYVLIHDSLLSMYRIRRDRNNIIKELYLLGMGQYYQSRSVSHISGPQADQYRFENEMVFTEGGSYMKFFPEIQDEKTKGYIIRCLANMTLSMRDKQRRIAITSQVLKIVQDDYYRSMAPSLPWDVFLRRSHQQMSANRSILSSGGLSTRELEAVLESCHVVFKPESDIDNPNIRWLWPYYEMEYTCGFVDLQTTLERLEKLILSVPYDQYDESGLYANIQLPIYYGDLIKKNPELQSKAHHRHFLVEAYQKMIQTLLTYPIEKINDGFLFDIRLVVNEYYEAEGLESYRSVVIKLMRRFFCRLYLHAQRASAILRRYCEEIMKQSPDFFDDIPFLRSIEPPEEKRRAVLDYASECGLFYDFGQMNLILERTGLTRNLFEKEFQMMKLHTTAGYSALKKRPSTEIFADIANGHHAWYQGAGGYPEDYVRNRSPYRQMADVVAVAAYLLDHPADAPEERIRDVIAQKRKRFSPLVTSFLSDQGLRKDLCALLSGDERPYYQELYRQLTASSDA